MRRSLLTLSVLAFAVPAMAVDDQFRATAGQVSVIIDAEKLTGNPGTLSVEVWPSAGTLEVRSGGLDVEYMHDADFVGVDAFQLDLETGMFGLSGTFWVFVSVAPTRIPISGDWTGDGITNVGLYDSDDMQFFLYQANEEEPDVREYTVTDANPGWWPIAGDWNGDGYDEVALYDPAEGAFHLFFLPPEEGELVPYSLSVTGPLGAGERPVAGRWNGGIVDGLGLYVPGEPAHFYLWGDGLAGLDVPFPSFGPGDSPVVGDWDGVNGESVGVYEPETTALHLANDNSTGEIDEVRVMLDAQGLPPQLPVIGVWDADPRVSVGLFSPLLERIALYPAGPPYDRAPIIEIGTTDPNCCS